MNNSVMSTIKITLLILILGICLSGCIVSSNGGGDVTNSPIVEAGFTPSPTPWFFTPTRRPIGPTHTPFSITPLPTVTGTPNPDGGLFSEIPCGPPCFWGIIPGETTDVHALELIQQRMTLRSCSVMDYRERAEGYYKIECRLSLIMGGGSSVTLFFDDQNIVESIHLSTSPVYTVEQVITKYGFPDSVTVWWTELVLPEENDENHHSVALLYFDKYYMGVGLEEKKGDTYRVTSTDQIVGINYYSPESYMAECKTNTWQGYSAEYYVGLANCP